MEWHLIHRAEVHWQATQFALIFADALHAIVNVRLHSLSEIYGSVYYMPLHLKKKEPEQSCTTPEAVSEAKISLHSYYCQRRSSEERRLQQDDSLE